MNKLPIVQYPLTTIMLDDDPVFLEGMKFNLNNSFIKFSTDQKEVKCFIKKHQQSGINYGKIMNYCYPEEISEKRMSINLGLIEEKINDDRKQNEFIVLVIDYDMPIQNGLDICEEIKADNVYKILLTGAASMPEVVNAYNNKLINMYIDKSNENLVEVLNREIVEAQQTYFQKFSANILSAINLDTNVKCYLGNRQYIDFISQYINEYNIVELYLFDHAGSYLIKDYNGCKSRLHIADLDMVKGVLESLPEDIDPKIRDDIKRRNKMLCVKNIDSYDKKMNFSKYMVNCNKIAAGSDLYYSIVPCQ